MSRPSTVQGIMQAIWREKGDSRRVHQRKAGVTPPLMRLIIGFFFLDESRAWDRDFMHGNIYTRDEVAFILGFHGLLRRSEIALRARDVSIQILPMEENMSISSSQSQRQIKEAKPWSSCVPISSKPASDSNISKLQVLEDHSVTVGSFA